MVTVIQAEWYRSTRAWRFWATVGLTLGVFVYTLYAFDNPWKLHIVIPHFYNVFTAVFTMLSGSAGSWWPLFLPLLAVLPAGDSLAVDRRRGVDAVFLVRVGWARYLVGKWAGNALVSVTAVALAMAATIIPAVIVYGTTLPKLLGWHFVHPPAISRARYVSGVFGHGYPPGFQPHFFWAHPVIYVGLAVLVALWATAALSGLSIAASVWIRVPLLTLAVPLVICWGVNWLATSSMLIPMIYGGGYLMMPAPLGPPSWAALGVYWAIPVVAVGGLCVAVSRGVREWPARTVGR